LWKRRRLARAGRAPIVVLFYHRVANDRGTRLTLPLDVFAAQIQLIRRHFPIVSLDEAHRRLNSGRNDRMACVITFDDGYASELHTSIPYLRFFGIPATSFVSAGQVIEQKRFAHDLARGCHGARPLTVEDLRRVDHGGITIGAHNWLHEDCGKLSGEELRRAICASNERLEEILGHRVREYAFPKGQKGVNITRESWELADRTYDIVCSAYGDYNFPSPGLKHVKRVGCPDSALGVLPIVDGFTGVRDLLRRDLWGASRAGELPY
jgi:peptidoglycan/xylan/chitin deacetylase (PgdA/CDA1 family)